MRKIIIFALVMVLLITGAIPALAMDYTKPVSSYPNTGGYYGWLTSAEGKYHVGVDFPATAGSDVYAVRDGIVRDARKTVGGYGQLNPSKPGPAIVIEHTDDNGKVFYALYGHVDFGAAVIYNGASVSKGQKIGTVISFYNGKSYSPHLHFGININNSSVTGYVGSKSDTKGFVDPVTFLDESSPRPLAVSADIPNGTYIIQGKGSDRNVHVSYGGLSNGQTVWILDAENTDAQRWSFERQSNGAYKIKALHSGKLMEVRDSSLENGADVAQWEDANLATQQWYVYATSGGWYEFVNANSGKALDVADGNTVNFTNVQQYERNNTDAQKFKLISYSVGTDIRLTDSNDGFGDDAVYSPGSYPNMNDVRGKDFNNKASCIEVPNGAGAVIFTDGGYGRSNALI